MTNKYVFLTFIQHSCHSHFFDLLIDQSSRIVISLNVFSLCETIAKSLSQTKIQQYIHSCVNNWYRHISILNVNKQYEKYRSLQITIGMTKQKFISYIPLSEKCKNILNSITLNLSNLNFARLLIKQFFIPHFLSL